MTTLNPDGVAQAELHGIPVVTGDSTRQAILSMVGVSRARLVVVAEDSAEQTVEISHVVRNVTSAPVLVRSHSGCDVAELSDAGVSNLVDAARTSDNALLLAVRDLLHIARPAPPVPGSSRTWVDTTKIWRPRVPADIDCTHATELAPVLPSAEGCGDCLHSGSRWVHLRMCANCGHVGCCDSSPNRHARAHFEQTGHPMMTSMEPGDDWVYCFVDDEAIEQEPSATRLAR